jgi:hypothetical protein
MKLLLDGDQRVIDILKTGKNGLAIGLQQLFLFALLLLKLAEQRSAVEDRLGDARGDGKEQRFWPEQAAQHGA